ncbi:MAG: 23S rRNA (uracil1939-C5)-methyltransferase [Chlamydiales bacterium]|jgi:23S rRNA (uracil1939-C5)-methyltransferase
MKQEYIVKGKIEAMAFGGKGILRHENMVVFVPMVAPGDIVSTLITKKKKSFAESKLVEIHEASPLRGPPKCPKYGQCGGCNMQHIKYSSQLDIKRAFVEDSLKRIGKLEIGEVSPVIPATKIWSYRRNIKLSLRPGNPGFHIGFVGIDKMSLVSVENCSIFTFEDDQILMNVRDIVKGLNCRRGNSGSVTILRVEGEQFTLHFQFKNEIPANFTDSMKRSLLTLAFFTGASVFCNGKELSIGNPISEFTLLDGIKITCSPRAFVQNHPEQSLHIYERVREAVAQTKSKKVLDLYCGIGCLSLILASSGFRVHGVENNPDAVRLAKSNAKLNGLDSLTSFTCSDVEKVLPEIMSSFSPDFLIVNPARVGLDPSVLKALNSSNLRDIIYISCMPPTLARDLSDLVKIGGFEILNVQPYDMFPQTSHVETVVHLRRP